MKSVTAILLTFTLMACVSSAPPQNVATAFSPLEFFTGPTKGDGALLYRSGKIDKSFSVSSHGEYTAAGQFLLKQVISWEDGREERRTFVLTPAGQGVYKGHFEDSNIKVRLWTDGTEVYLRHALPGTPFLRIKQVMTLGADEHTLTNKGTVRFMRVPVRYLHETITKL